MKSPAQRRRTTPTNFWITCAIGALASVTYVIGDAAFVHDTIFPPDFGTARADFPGGDAHQLWDSIQAILALPGETRLFTGHDYMPGGREPEWESTVGEQKQVNTRGGRLPEPEANGKRYLKIPLDALEGAAWE